jgi:hypothetical protein
LQGAADRAERGVGERKVAEIVGEIHGRDSKEGLTGRVDGDGEGAVQIGRDAGFVREEITRDERADFALRLHGDLLPGAKMPRIALRRGGGG